VDEPTDPLVGLKLGSVEADDLLSQLRSPRLSHDRVLATEAGEFAIVATRDQSESLDGEPEQTGADKVRHSAAGRGLLGRGRAWRMDPVRLGVGGSGVEELTTFVKSQPLKAKRVGVFVDSSTEVASAVVVVHARNVALLNVSVRPQSDLGGGFSCTFQLRNNATHPRLPTGPTCK